MDFTESEKQLLRTGLLGLLVRDTESRNTLETLKAKGKLRHANTVIATVKRHETSVSALHSKLLRAAIRYTY